MSDVNLDFTVSNNNINFTVEPNDITITPTDIQLTFSAGGLASPSSPLNSVQFNNNSQFAGSDNFKFYPSNSTIAVTNILVGNNAAFTSNIETIHISGGTNGYVLQTDGTGNLSWTAQSGGGGGNGTPGGSDTQVQFNDGGLFGGNVGFTFNKTTGNLNVPGIINGNISNANYALYSGNANIANTANSVSGSNVVGQVSTANYASYSGNANIANTTYLATYATIANSVAGSNVSGQVANALVASTVYTNAQPNITSVGTLTSLDVSGNVAAGNLNIGGFYANAIYLNAPSGTLYFNRGTVAINPGNSGTSSNSQVLINSGNVGNNPYSISIGTYSYSANVQTYGIQMGLEASANANSIAIGAYAGSGRAIRGVFLGNHAYNNTSLNFIQGTIAIGDSSGGNIGQDAITIGHNTQGNHVDNSIAIGANAGINQNTNAIALGAYAAYGNVGANTQGANSIAIGYSSGYTIAHANTIILNATGSDLSSTQANSLFVKPIRDVTGNAAFTKTLKYNPTTGEIGFI